MSSSSLVTISVPSPTPISSPSFPCTIIFRGTPHQVDSTPALSRSFRLQTANFAIPSFSSFSIPSDFPVEGSFPPVATFLNGLDLTFSLEDRLFIWVMAVYLQIPSIIPGLCDYILDYIENPSFIRLLDWLFRSHCDLTLPMNMLRETIPLPELLANPLFESVDPGFLDLYFAGVGGEGNEFLLRRGGKLLRWVKLNELSSEELRKLIRNPSIDLNWLRTSLAGIARNRTDRV
jgi:hypothetical protein